MVQVLILEYKCNLHIFRRIHWPIVMSYKLDYSAWSSKVKNLEMRFLQSYSAGQRPIFTAVTAFQMVMLLFPSLVSCLRYISVSHV
jgi:hypothetical protein